MRDFKAKKAEKKKSWSGGSRRRRWVLDIIRLIEFRLSSLPPPAIGNSKRCLLSQEATNGNKACQGLYAASRDKRLHIPEACKPRLADFPIAMSEDIVAMDGDRASVLV